MVMVTPRVGDLGVDRTNALFISAALGSGERIGVAPVMLQRRNLRSVRTRRKVFQAKVYADGSGARGKVVHNFALKRDVPPTPSVLNESAAFTNTFDLSRLPEAVFAAQVMKGVTLYLGAVPHSKWNPSQRPLRTDASAEPRTPAVVVAGIRKLFTRPRHGIAVNPKITRNPTRHGVKVKICGPASRRSAEPATLRFPLC